MDTIVSVQVISERAAEETQRALGWFGQVERVCSRFDPASEVFRLSTHVGIPVDVSALLFEAVRFAVQVAELSGGLFDPTIGSAQARRGFDRNYVTGQHVAAPDTADAVSYRDVVLDEQLRTIMLREPLLIDLGAVAKGMAIDLAAQELAGFDSFSIDAGGDLYVKGRNEDGEPWRVGIEHPRVPGLIATLALTEGAVCTSGDYERRRPGVEGEHHLLDPRTGQSPQQAISCTIVAPTAMAADALSTAAFIAGPSEGLRLLDEQGVDGMIVSPAFGMSMTPHFERWLA
ncbi:MAG: FAD:protein FMN transferase [Chloroflexota bacterium]